MMGISTRGMAAPRLAQSNADIPAAAQVRWVVPPLVATASLPALRRAMTGTQMTATVARRRARWSAGSRAAVQSPTCVRPRVGTRSWPEARHAMTAAQRAGA